MELILLPRTEEILELHHFVEFLTHQVTGDVSGINSDIQYWMSHGKKP